MLRGYQPKAGKHFTADLGISCYLLLEGLGLSKSFNLAVAREDILVEIRIATSQEGILTADLAHLFRDRFSKDKVTYHLNAALQASRERASTAMLALKLPSLYSTCRILPLHPVAKESLHCKPTITRPLRQQAAIQKAAFEQRKEERKEAALTASTASHKRQAEDSPQQGRQLPRRGNFLVRNTKDIAYKNWQRTSSCPYGDSCKFGHFILDASFRPTGGNAQPLHPREAASQVGPEGLNQVCRPRLPVIAEFRAPLAISEGLINPELDEPAQFLVGSEAFQDELDGQLLESEPLLGHQATGAAAIHSHFKQATRPTWDAACSKLAFYDTSH